MKLKINRKIEITISSSKIKELKRIAEQRGKSLEYCLNEAIREYVMLENFDFFLYIRIIKNNR